MVIFYRKVTVDSLDIFVLKYIANEAFLFGFFSLCGFCMIPPTCKSYLQWKKTQKHKDFMSALIQGVAALLCLSSVYPIFVSGVIKLESMPVFSSGILGVLLFLSPFFAFYFFSSKAYRLCQKCKLIKSTAIFSLTCICGMISFYSISVYFIILLKPIMFLVEIL
jgi:hypothetical protein